VTNVDVALEAAKHGANSQMAAAQAAGIDVLSGGETIVFTLYKRVVLPIDGFVFWIRADTLAANSSLNSSPLNSVPFNTMPSVASPAGFKQIKPSSLHHTTVNEQSEDESFSRQTMTLTCQQQVDFLTDIAPTDLWIAERHGTRFAFSQRSGFYRQANTYHYRGEALYPALETQVIDFPEQLDNRQIVSNSLPIWLRLANTFPIYPGFLVPDNLPPPYASVHIGDDDTTPIQSFPWTNAMGDRYQLVRDFVRITTYGVRNDEILDWLEFVTQYTLNNPGVMGLMNSPINRDSKRGQTEMSIIAQKKIITVEVDYYQTRIVNLARQLITSAFIEDFYLDDYVPRGYDGIRILVSDDFRIITNGGIRTVIFSKDDIRITTDGGERMITTGQIRTLEPDINP
jgi:hypothetical protein